MLAQAHHTDAVAYPGRIQVMAASNEAGEGDLAGVKGGPEREAAPVVFVKLAKVCAQVGLNRDAADVGQARKYGDSFTVILMDQCFAPWGEQNPNARFESSYPGNETLQLVLILLELGGSVEAFCEWTVAARIIATRKGTAIKNSPGAHANS